MARKITVRAFAAWIEDEVNLAEVLRRIAGGLTLQKAAVAVKQPYTCLHEFFHSTPERQGRYEAARKAWADAKMDEAIALVDGVAPDRDHVAKAKLQVETYHNQAKAYHRDRWGETLRVERAVGVPSDAGLLGFASELLELVKTGAVPSLPAERLIGGGSAAEPEQVPDTAAELARAAAE